MTRKIKTAAAFVSAATFALVLFAAPAGAATPAVQGCVGSTFSVNAQNSQSPPGNFGHGVASFAQDPSSSPGMGDAMQLLQAGDVPTNVVPNTCSD